MLVIGDFKQMEWNTCAYLSQDPVAIKELNDGGVDLHSENQKAFDLPSRLIAKVFLFRLIFGGSAWSYANDPEFIEVSDKPKFWQEVIDKFYEKYSGVQKWHDCLMQEAMNTGRITLPTGRFFPFYPTAKNGEYIWPRTNILNYPVQGLGADLMILARILMQKGIEKKKLMGRMVETVHDSIMVDCPDKEVEEFKQVFYRSWELIPKLFLIKYNKVYNVTCKVELKIGPSWGNMKKLEENE